MSPDIAEQMSAILETRGGHVGQSGVFSLTLAEVKDIKDDKNLNRVKCLPIGAPPEEMTDWCYVMTPMGGKDRGLFLFPQVGDLVVLGYLANDIHRPIVLGSYWNSEVKAPVAVDKGKAEDYVLKTPSQVEMTLHDEKKKQKLTITMPSGIKVEIDDDQQTVTTKDKNGDNLISMKMKSGEIVVKAKDKVVLNAADKAKLILEKSGKITLTGNADVAINGQSIAVKSKGKLDMQGVDVGLQAKGQLNVKSSGVASVKGSILKLN